MGGYLVREVPMRRTRWLVNVPASYTSPQGYVLVEPDDHPAQPVRLEPAQHRFSLSEDGRRIRANQGHSIEVEPGCAPGEPLSIR